MKKILYTILFAISASCLIPENLAAQTKLAFDGPYAGVSLGYNQTHVSEGGGLQYNTRLAQAHPMLDLTKTILQAMERIPNQMGLLRG